MLQGEGVGVPSGPGSRERNPQAVSALRASIPDTCRWVHRALERLLGWHVVPLCAFAVVSHKLLLDAGYQFDEWFLCLLVYIHYSHKIDVLFAQGMSTGTAKTPKAVEGRSPASPVRDSGCAQTTERPSPSSPSITGEG